MSAAKNNAPNTVAAVSGRQCQTSRKTKASARKCTAPATDSRTKVVRAQVDAERQLKRRAPWATTLPERAALLRDLLDEAPATDADSQADRLLRALRIGPVTSHEARQYLDVIHPAGRIKTLRDRGHEIVTVWVVQLSSAGKPHRIGRWALVRKGV